MPLSLTMDPSEFKTEDICDFAERLGFTGVDSDLFYEAYYAMDPEESERLLALECEDAWMGA